MAATSQCADAIRIVDLSSASVILYIACVIAVKLILNKVHKRKHTSLRKQSYLASFFFEVCAFHVKCLATHIGGLSVHSLCCGTEELLTCGCLVGRVLLKGSYPLVAITGAHSPCCRLTFLSVCRSCWQVNQISELQEAIIIHA